jgi:hypothetical protein
MFSNDVMTTKVVDVEGRMTPLPRRLVGRLLDIFETEEGVCITADFGCGITATLQPDQWMFAVRRTTDKAMRPKSRKG